MSDSPEADADKMPADEELEEPSTEKEPGDEPKDGDDTPDDVDHEAVGVGVVEHEPVGEGSPDDTVAPPHPSAGSPDTSDR